MGLARTAWRTYQFAPLLAIVALVGLAVGWAVALVLVAPFLLMVAWIRLYGNKYARRHAQMMDTDPQYAAKFEREQTAYFRAMGLALPFLAAVALTVLIVVAATR